MASATANNTMTMAASGHCPIKTAPVTAMLMSALIFKLALITAVQPFLYVSRPLHPMATTAQRKLNQAGAPNQYKPSATTAKIPATTTGHQRVDVLSDRKSVV